MRADPAAPPTDTNGGRLLLVLASRDRQSVAELAAATGQHRRITFRHLQHLLDRGFVVVGTPAAVAVYQLNPKGLRTEVLAPQQRVLLVEEDLALQELVTMILEDEGYGVIATTTLVEATRLLTAVSFDLVITDGFSQLPQAVFATTADLRAAAGATPVALFSAHQLELDAAQAAGFATLIGQPFELEKLEAQIRQLLNRV